MSDSDHIDNTLLFESAAPSFEAEQYHVREMHGVEALSTPYEYRVVFECGVDGGIPPDGVAELLSATAQIGFGPEGAHRVGGVLRQIELLEMENVGQRTLYECILVPRFWLTTQTRRTQCFNEKAVPDVIREVLEEYGLAEDTDYELRLNETYTAREYITQYEETDFAFLSRWMERLGMFYWFEQQDEHEKLIIADSNSAFVTAPEHPELTYSHGQHGRVGSLHHLRRRDRRVPKSLVVRDYNWRTPQTPVSGTADIDAEKGAGLQAYYGDHFRDDGEGATYARLRAEGFNATKHVFTAWSVNPDFSPGYRYTLSGAPVGELDTEYVITRTVHRATQGTQGAGSGDYRNELEAIGFTTPYRAPRVTPWPRIDGILHAYVDAESISSAAPIDDKGRYKVVFPCDLYGEFGGRASRWVRKAEPYTGGDYGMHFTLHVGAEVAIGHLQGDPDRPIIIGTIPNATTTSPLTSTNATRSVIRTRSGILFDFEDDAS
jgi:type VI secretion system secreted protein VgrG